MQIINVALGGNLIQHLENAALHEYKEQDQYHITRALPGGIFHQLYGKTPVANSAHHQGLLNLGCNLRATQFSLDHVIEGIECLNAPVIGTQYHPERMITENPSRSHINGLLIFQYFKTLLLSV